MRSVQVSKANGPFEIMERDVPEPVEGKDKDFSNTDSTTSGGKLLI